VSRCARCGLQEGAGPGLCEASSDEPDERGEATVACRDREIANLHSLLRSVTAKLERAADELSGRNDDRLLLPMQLINAVLEVLS
jgi:hypothetical protein